MHLKQSIWAGFNILLVCINDINDNNLGHNKKSAPNQLEQNNWLMINK